FQCYLAAGAVTLTKTATITVVPRTPADGVTIDTLFLTDDNGIPLQGFSAGSDINLNILSISSFPMTIPATVRFELNSSDMDRIMDQQINIPNGPNVATLQTSLPFDAPDGLYTFTATITYADEDGITKIVTQTTTFIVSDDPPDPVEAISIHALAAADING